MSDIALFTIIRTDRNMLLACYSHKHISYRIRTIIRKAIICKIRSFPFCMPHLKKTHFKLFCCNKIETKVLSLALFG
ncbi:hypothetical protein [Wolbachia endosymbiont (group A) of Scambus nigricans]|uniref:hypothetical protein n=1 Tax=Wolbachia endosymbiont (group A) of Scambus nigricans TaxID=2954055 RepID=UPI00222FB33C|nr:hypothetical protein [Wolbachia endosymbiont (group A) of Scambus nigricans]